MPVAGVIAEYNPFHNGHKYLIDKAKSDTHLPSDEILTIAVMSGNFVQRGIPSIINKWEKAKILKQPAQISFKSCFRHLLAVVPGQVT